LPRLMIRTSTATCGRIRLANRRRVRPLPLLEGRYGRPA
jgi:hypothetical protein